MAKISP